MLFKKIKLHASIIILTLIIVKPIFTYTIGAKVFSRSKLFTTNVDRERVYLQTRIMQYRSKSLTSSGVRG